MNKSLQAVRFTAVLNHIIHPCSMIIILFLFLNSPLSYYTVNAQETSVGIAPLSGINISPQEPGPFAVGTRAFIQSFTAPSTFQFGRSFMESCTVTNIGGPFAMPSLGGLVYRNGIIYTWNQVSPYQLWNTDTVTGSHTLVFNITGVPLANLTGMCYDGTTMYGVATNTISSQIFSISMTTGVCTLIGTTSVTCSYAVLIFGRQFAQSSLFSADAVGDDICKWNKSTGVATLIGPAGFNVTPGEDASFDGNTCYWVANNQLMKWDSIGTLTVLCTYSSQATGIECIPGSTIFPPSPYYPTICRNGLNIYVPQFPPYVRDTIRMIGNNFCSLLDMNVKIDTFIHTWDSDMIFSLFHNGSNKVDLITNRGGSGDNFIGTILNDSAATPIANGNAPFTGSFRPEQPLAIYNNQSPAGSWELWMQDVAGGDTGFLRAWCITFLFTCPTGGITTVEVPVTYILEQNYPNPFNPVTTIKYGLPKFGKTSLIIYDILGRVVTVLVDNEFKDAGTYEVTFDASNFASGVYFYTLESGTYKETKKMLLVK
jgi:hypothetical protein